VKYIVAHGTCANPEANWFPWLQKVACRAGHECYIPRFPTPEAQYLTSWLQVFDRCCPELDDQTVLVGHSIGAALILRVLERSSQRVHATVCTSGWLGLLENDFFDPLITSFFEAPFNWNSIRKRAGRIVCFWGEGDPYVSQDKAQALADNLLVPLTVIPNGGHLNAESGFLSFPPLFEALEDA